LFLFERAFEPSTIKGSAFPILPPFERAFEPSSYLHLRAPSSPRLISFSSTPSSPRPSKVVHFLSYLHSSVPSSPRLISIRARLRALVLSPFECAFKPSSYLHSSAPLSPRLISISRAPSSPRPSKVVHFLSYLLLSAPSSPHFL